MHETAATLPMPTPAGTDDTLPAVRRTARGTEPQGPYADRHELAHGGMGRIVSAYDTRLGRRVALKELLAATPHLRARFHREALLTARLEHPSIVAVHEVGTWPSGEPYYAMRLVAGRSLDRVISEAASLDERIALVPHVIAVADALAYAHSKRIIHRDLKPHNVMVGEFGETVVIDWGLAKDLAEAPAPPTEASMPDDVGATAYGQVLGTPAYMAPEQALGEPLDERADVYAIGAILYHVLSGRPPYVARSTAAVLAALDAGPPASLATVVPGVPRDLRAIVERAMARERADRYATARELASDLKRFQAGQLVSAHDYSWWQLARRFVRRHRGPLAIAACAVIACGATATISIERIVNARRAAELAHDQAVAQRRDAESLLEYLLWDLREKLRPIGQLDLLAAISERANDYYHRHAPTDPAQQRQAAEAVFGVGEVESSRGNPVAAIAHFREALALAEAGRAEPPYLAQIHNALGGEAVLQHDMDTAEQEYRQAIELCEHAPADDPDRTLQLAVALEGAAETQEGRGKPKGALDFARRALKVCDADRGACTQEDVAALHERIAISLTESGDLEGSAREYRSAIQMEDELAAKDPDNQRAVFSAASMRTELSFTLAELGDPAAQRELEQALATGQRLVALDATDMTFQDLILTAHENFALLFERRKDAAHQLEHARAAAAIVDAAPADTSGNLAIPREVAVAHRILARALQAAGDVPGAARESALVEQTAEQLVQSSPTDVLLRLDLGLAKQTRGTALRASGDLAGAVERHEAARAQLERLRAEAPEMIEVSGDLAEVHLELARDHLAREDREAAREQRALAIDLARQLTKLSPASVEARKLLADALALEL